MVVFEEKEKEKEGQSSEDNGAASINRLLNHNRPPIQRIPFPVNRPPSPDRPVTGVATYLLRLRSQRIMREMSSGYPSSQRLMDEPSIPAAQPSIQAVLPRRDPLANPQSSNAASTTGSTHKRVRFSQANTSRSSSVPERSNRYEDDYAVTDGAHEILRERNFSYPPPFSLEPLPPGAERFLEELSSFHEVMNRRLSEMGIHVEDGTRSRRGRPFIEGQGHQRGKPGSEGSQQPGASAGGDLFSRRGTSAEGSSRSQEGTSTGSGPFSEPGTSSGAARLRPQRPISSRGGSRSQPGTSAGDGQFSRRSASAEGSSRSQQGTSTGSGPFSQRGTSPGAARLRPLRSISAERTVRPTFGAVSESQALNLPDQSLRDPKIPDYQYLPDRFQPRLLTFRQACEVMHFFNVDTHYSLIRSTLLDYSVKIRGIDDCPPRDLMLAVFLFIEQHFQIQPEIEMCVRPISDNDQNVVGVVFQRIPQRVHILKNGRNLKNPNYKILYNDDISWIINSYDY